MLQPYAGSAESGNVSFASDDLNRTVRLADAAGWQIITHASGDRAVRMALNAYAHAIRANRPPARGRRHRLESAEVVHAADVRRFGPLNVTVSLQPFRSSAPLNERDALTTALGDERRARSFALADIADQTRIVLGSAWPEYPLNPIFGLSIAVQGGPSAVPSNATVQPTQRLQLETAIDAYTSNAAWASFDDQRKGSISAGMLADMVVLSDDVFTLPSEKLGTVSVVATIFDGKVVYRKGSPLETEPVPSLQH
jgi:predicted amidohydrolase YtcJ